MTYRYFSPKSVLLKGSIKDFIVYKLCPITEFSEGTWQLSIVSLAYKVLPIVNEINDFFTVSCNLIKGQKYSTSNEVENYELPLSTFILENKPTTLTQRIIYFEKNWFHINALSSELKIRLNNENNVNFFYNAEIYIQVLFQRCF